MILLKFTVLILGMGFLSFAPIVLTLGQCDPPESVSAKESDALAAPQLERIRRFLPPDSKITSQWLVSKSGSVHYELDAVTPSGPVIVRVDEAGFPLEIAEVLTLADLPDAVRSRAPPGNSPSRLERVWLCLFEREIPSRGVEWEVLLDPLGRERLRTQDLEGPEPAVRWSDLPIPVRRGLAPYLLGAIPHRIKMVHEWERDLFEVKWRSERGTEELKILPSGEALFWEPPIRPSLPDALKKVAAWRSLELVYLAIYRLTAADGVTEWLPDGASPPDPGEDPSQAP